MTKKYLLTMPVESRFRNPDLDFNFFKLTPGHSALLLLLLSTNLFFLKIYILIEA